MACCACARRPCTIVCMHMALAEHPCLHASDLQRTSHMRMHACRNDQNGTGSKPNGGRGAFLAHKQAHSSTACMSLFETAKEAVCRHERQVAGTCRRPAMKSSRGTPMRAKTTVMSSTRDTGRCSALKAGLLGEGAAGVGAARTSTCRPACSARAHSNPSTSNSAQAVDLHVAQGLVLSLHPMQP